MYNLNMIIAEYLHVLLVATQASKHVLPMLSTLTQLAMCTCCISPKATSQFAVHVLSFTSYMHTPFRDL